MPVMKKTILYSLFIVSSVNFSLHSQDTNMQDNEDLLLIFDDNSEEVHPLEDIDAINLTPEIQSYVHDLEFDPIAQLENMVENNDQILPQEIIEARNIQIPEVLDTVVLPAAPEDIMILDCHNAAEQEPSESDTIAYEVDEDQILNGQLVNIKNSEVVDASDVIDISEQIEECPVSAIEQSQLEDLLTMQCQQMEQYLFDAMTVSSPQPDDCQTISIEDQQALIALDNGINLINHDEATITEDDDIVPVPHDLINSVKKANKQKKKLEKKEKAQLRKSNKKNKKASDKN